MPRKISRKKHSAKVKFQVALESLRDNTKMIEVARTYGINPNLVTKWRKEFLEKGYLVFERDAPAETSERKIDNLQRIIGKKEVEIELLKKYLGNLSSP